MRAFKTRLTKIKKLITEKIPDGKDVLGFAGVTREMLQNTCQEIYDLSDQIEAKDDDHHFEVIALKRFESDLHEKLNDFLEHGVSSDKVKEKFDKFLTDLSKLYERTKLVYFIVNKNGLRDDLELANLRAQVEALKAQKIEYEKLISDLATQAEAAKTLHGTITTEHAAAQTAISGFRSQAETDSSEVATAKGEVITWHKSISETHEKMVGWDKDIEGTLNDAKANEGLMKGHLGTMSASLTTLNEAIVGSAKLTEESRATADKNTNLISQIEATLGDANRTSMAASFKERMEEMTEVRDSWRNIFIAVMGVFVAASIGIIYFHLSSVTVSLQALVARLTILTPVVWLAWFAARQYGFANKSREDYAFKYSSAMAYEGYRKAVRETQNKELEQVLIEIAMYNMALHPIRLYAAAQSDHASPFSAFLDQVFERIPGLKKLKVQTAAISGEAEIASAPSGVGKS
ncbi:hypothetical protein [Geothrix oryzisoli]|uniref:hypothetical protein n=1 Tax=Geothrix oryzisoli TaxID=2922721 RepID=UPI001FAB5F62|nr:hypothetical protein [Geothrix oryzisoli]